jgi:hypothetical protein
MFFIQRGTNKKCVINDSNENRQKSIVYINIFFLNYTSENQDTMCFYICTLQIIPSYKKRKENHGD